MRPPRVAILALFLAASLFLFCRALTSGRRSGPVIASSRPPAAAAPKSSFGFFSSLSTPFSLFPPSAAISLIDDNSTFFAARPAAFGPPLPSKGITGQLWIGSGFDDDDLEDGDNQGELGCSDVPGWDDGSANMAMKAAAAAAAQGSAPHAKSATAAGKAKASSKRDAGLDKGPLVDRSSTSEARQPRPRAGPVDDGTDDYLHQALQNTPGSGRGSSSSGPGHADIQSIQEAAEITGKVVLLRRGGCGFLEKVKWAQRRGAIAVIVGDNQRGGPLIQMFARGDTSNVTIPAIFTAYTTAHLLSSLMQPGSYVEDIIDESGNAALKVQHFDKSHKGKNAKQPQATVIAATTAVPKPTGPPPSPKGKEKKPPHLAVGKEGAVDDTAKPAPGSQRRGWISDLFSWGGGAHAVTGKSRPPSSGRLDWVMVDDWNTDKDKVIQTSLEKSSSKDGSGKPSAADQKPHDSFQIGVQDWRDPDLVDAPAKKDKTPAPAKEAGKAAKKPADGKGDKAAEAGSPGASAKQTGGTTGDANGPKGGSITPGSGEYSSQAGSAKNKGGSSGAKADAGAGAESQGHGGLMSKLFGDDDGADFVTPTEPRPDPLGTPVVPDDIPFVVGSGSGGREGLWVTITPTSSASPFFDTLLVLVVSPLITLSVVYSLLIMRARLRRRRWRAPKSVVEQLPVRTYHTIAPSPTASPRLPSPSSTSPTTPLLQSSGSSPTRPRPRSRTATGVPDADDLLRADTALHQTSRPGSRSASRSERHEKGPSQHASQWKKYMGRQVECVVCLEEYVDGVSQVMSLPCGHEFHVECITPWLTTRRRTCPICKGDVVRSLARGSPAGPRYDSYQDDDDESDDEAYYPEAESSTSASRRPVPARPRSPDIEEGLRSPSPPLPPRRTPRSSEGWFRIISGGLGSGAGSSSHGGRTSPAHRGRDRSRSRDRDR